MNLSVAAKRVLVGYARVSTEDQSLDLQIDALRRAGVKPDNIHIDTKTGASINRDGLESALEDLRSGDTLIVWRIDRLCRNIRQLYTTLDRVYVKGAAFRSLSESFGFNTMSGKLVLGVLSLVAEFERQIISSRTTAGMAAVRARRGKGETWGPPVYMTPERIKRVGELLNSGLSGPEVAKKMGISPASVYGYWKQIGLHRWRRKLLPSLKRHKD
jgi:DNA invertase Pin-like site-specific DNA recombinase